MSMPVTRRKATWRLLAGVALFIAGFSAIFVLLSVVLAQLGAAPWLKGQSWVTIILGALVVLMGIVFLGGLQSFRPINACIAVRSPGCGVHRFWA